MSAWSEASVLFEPLQSELRFLPEGPISLGNGCFSWVAIQHGPNARVGSLNLFDTKTLQNRSFLLPGRPGFARPTTDPNKFLVGAERELGVYDLSTGKWDPIVQGIDSDVANTIVNDATTYRDCVIFGTKDLEFKTRKAGLYLFRGSDRALIRMRADQICSNGKAVVEGGNGQLYLYDIDSPTRKVVRYDLDIGLGKLSNQVTVVDLSNATGVPDGMTLTPDGKSTIVSLYNPEEASFGLTEQYSLSSGQLEYSWRTPASPQNTCPLLMQAPDGSVKLVITTAVEHMPAERQPNSPHAGAIFIADTTLSSVRPTSPFPIASLQN